jgi:TolA-binding protein
MSSFLSQRGAVHILFLIFVLVIALAFGGLWFVELQDNEEAVNARKTAEYSARIAQDEALFARDYYSAVAKLAGGSIPSDMPQPEDETTSAADVAAPAVSRTQLELASVGARVDDPSTRPKNLRSAWEPLINRYQTLKGEIAQLKTEIERLKGEVAQRDSQISSNSQSHQAELTRIQEEWEATKSTLNSQLDDLRNQNDSLSTQVRESQDENASEREKNNTARTVLADKTEDLESKVRSMHSEQKIRRATQAPDGSVVGVDNRSGRCFIDVGSDDMLRRGTRFKVFEIGKGGAKTAKGWITVTNTASGKSECAIEEGAVDAQDVIYNPIYDKNATVRFCIIGDLPGKYNKETAVRILRKLGAKVQTNVDIHTDFIVLGMRESEDADEVTDRDDYRNAQRWGVEMIRARDLQAFLQL